MTKAERVIEAMAIDVWGMTSDGKTEPTPALKSAFRDIAMQIFDGMILTLEQEGLRVVSASSIPDSVLNTFVEERFCGSAELVHARTRKAWTDAITALPIWPREHEIKP